MVKIVAKQSQGQAFPPLSKDGACVAPLLDHTLLTADAGRKQVLRLCEEARHYGFAAVCVTPYWLPVVVQALKGSDVCPCTVIGFPLGASPLETKAHEARVCARSGARELDMVIAVSALKDGQHDLVLRDIQAVVQAAKGKTVKVILETGLLTRAEKIVACKLAVQAGAHYVKTSTGFSGGATLQDIRLMRRTVGEQCRIKASGGIRTCAQALAMLKAGADRIGASAGVAMVT